MTNEDYDKRIRAAITIAVEYGGIDGAHHKQWTIDQMVRALCGAPCVNDDGTSEGESSYREVVRDACNGEDGPETYEWDVGIAP